MSRWDDEKVKVKDVFDSIRNFGLCGLVFFVGIQILIRQPTNEYILYINKATAACIIILSIYLFFLNLRSFHRTVKKEYEDGNIGALFFLIIPAFIFMLGVHVFVQTAFSLQMGDGKKVGELSLPDLIPNKSTSNDNH